MIPSMDGPSTSTGSKVLLAPRHIVHNDLENQNLQQWNYTMKN